MAELHGGIGDLAAGLAAAEVTYEASFATQRMQHAALETHATIGWLGDAGRLLLRTTTQTPFLTRGHCAALFGLARTRCGWSPNGSAAASAASRRC